MLRTFEHCLYVDLVVLWVTSFCSFNRQVPAFCTGITCIFNYYPENGSSRFFLHVGTYLLEYTAS